MLHGEATFELLLAWTLWVSSERSVVKSDYSSLPHTVQFCFLPSLSSVYRLVLRWHKTHKGMNGVGFEPSSNLL